MHLTRRHLTPTVLAVLCRLAEEHGFDAAWVHRQLAQGRRDAMEIVSRWGHNAVRELRRVYEEHSGQTTHEQNRANARNQQITERRSQHNSLRGAQAEPTSMANNGEEHNMGDAPEEGGEQQITKPTHIWRRFPNTETACLKWVQSIFLNDASNTTIPPKMPFDIQNVVATTDLSNSGGGVLSTPTVITTMTQTTGQNYNTPQLLQLRMTSPYNIVKTQIGSQTVGNSQPVWLELFDQKYQYYHVMETEWEVTFNFGFPNNGTSTITQGQNYGLYIFWKYTNEDDPPVSWTAGTGSIANVGGPSDTDDLGEKIDVTKMTNSLGTQPLTADDYFRMGGWHHKHVTFNTTHHERHIIHGKYKFGQCKMDIKTISGSDAHSAATTAEGWSQARATPAFPEILSIIVVRDNACDAQTTIADSWNKDRSPA